jgi:hypothetical protein
MAMASVSLMPMTISFGLTVAILKLPNSSTKTNFVVVILNTG